MQDQLVPPISPRTVNWLRRNFTRRAALGELAAVVAATLSLAACAGLDATTSTGSAGTSPGTTAGSAANSATTSTVNGVTVVVTHSGQSAATATTGTAASASAPLIAVETPTPLATTTPQAVALTYLAAWQKQDYKGMYALLSQEAAATITQDNFVNRYGAIWNEVGAITIKVALTANQDPNASVQHFHLSLATALVGSVEQDNAIPLIQEGAVWKVQWLPSLIFKELSGDNLIHMFPLALDRGDILDRNGKQLATQVNYTSLGLVPQDVKDEAGMLKAVSAALSYPPDKLAALYAKAKQNPSWLQPVQLLAPDKADAIQAALGSVAGVTFNKELLRGYPAKEQAAQTVGYLGEINAQELNKLWQSGYMDGDWVGRSGIESWGEKQLAGRRGGKLAVITQNGTVDTVIAEKAPTAGQTVMLTIDLALQQVAQQALGSYKGSVAVMRVSDGSLLAFASSPTFDPNSIIFGLTDAEAQALFQNPDQPFTNRPAQGAYPAGSTFKTVTMGSVLAENVYNASSMFECKGVWDNLGIPMHCWKTTGHGKISLSEGLTQSCDIVFYMCGSSMNTKGATVFPQAAGTFGVGQPTGIVGVDEASGILPSPDWKNKALTQIWYPGDAVNLAIGQGYLLVTPLQMVNWIAAIANGGTLWTPRIIDKMIAKTGEITQPGPVTKRGTLAASPDELATVRAAMRQVIAETTNWNGTGSWAFRDYPIAVAGKTGTAQSGQSQPHAWFASFAPYDKPEIAVVAMAEHAGEGADVAAPICRTVYEAYFNMPWQAHVAAAHQECTTTEYLCPVGWKRVQSSIGQDTYIPR